MRNGQRIEVAIAKEEQARCEAEAEGHDGENRTGYVRDGEDGSGGEDSGVGIRDEAEKSAEEEVL